MFWTGTLGQEAPWMAQKKKKKKSKVNKNVKFSKFIVQSVNKTSMKFYHQNF